MNLVVATYVVMKLNSNLAGIVRAYSTIYIVAKRLSVYCNHCECIAAYMFGGGSGFETNRENNYGSYGALIVWTSNNWLSVERLCDCISV